MCAALLFGVPNQNNNQSSQNIPQKQAERDREQAERERSPHRGSDELDRERDGSAQRDKK